MRMLVLSWIHQCLLLLVGSIVSGGEEGLPPEYQRAYDLVDVVPGENEKNR